MKVICAIIGLTACLLLNACSPAKPVAWEYRAVDGRFLVGHALVCFSRSTAPELREIKTDAAIDRSKYGIAESEEAALIEQVLGKMGVYGFELVAFKDWPDNRFTLVFKRPVN